MALWRFGREDLVPVLLIALLPLAVALPQLLGFLLANPVLYVGWMATGFQPGLLPGPPFIDPNNGFTTQALGYRAALDWLNGVVPWWNPYTGVGLPLAAEYQPAAFFPLTFLLLLPRGMVLQELALQILAGLGTYGLLRQTGIGRLAATTGALLYAFNGTLAWFAHGPAQPVPFLPWMLWAIERAHAKASLGLPGGWRLLACAMAMSLLAGFPETAYIGGLLALGWAVVRGVQAQPSARTGYAWRIALGGVVGIAIAAPQILAFFQYLPLAHIGGHADRFVHEAMGGEALVPSLIAPYANGPIFGYVGQRPALWTIWGGIGGYVTLALVVLAAYGFLARRGAIGWLLLGWCVLALAKTFGLQPAVFLLNLIPGVTLAAFYRYAPPSWELALVILAVWGVDQLARGGPAKRPAWLGAALVLAVAAVAGLHYGSLSWPAVRETVGMRNWAVGSGVLAALSAITACLLIGLAPARRAATAIAAILVVDAMLMFAIPTLSNPRAGRIDWPAVEFLRANLGLQRFYSLGPISPNYGAMFGIASINHNYLPVAQRWAEFMQKRLDTGNTEAVVFDGRRSAGGKTATQELRANLAAYLWVGVKYVVAPSAHDPLPELRTVYRDEVMRIVELPDPAPYFEPLAGNCRVEARGRTHAAVDCAQPATLVRRELYFPGWSATVNGQPAPIAEHERLFQAIAVPAGKSEVRFAYAPPHIGWAWLAAALALATLLVSLVRGRAALRS